MNPKWSMLGLVGLGVVAAFCAALLMASLRARRAPVSQNMAPAEIKLLIANQDLPARTILEADAVTQVTVNADDAPQGYLSHAALAIGKPLAVPVMQGQALTRGCFAADGPGAKMASVLEPGKVAVSVELSRHSGMLGLLYPGCVVDVLGSFRLPPSANQNAGQAVSTTLIQGVQVLAIENRTLFADGQGDSPVTALPSKKPMVTLMVDLKQAKALQLALEHGTVSLALRNPNDDSVTTGEAMLLKGGQLSDSLAMFEGTDSEAQDAINLFANDDASPEPDAYWKTTVIRGVTFDTKTFSRPKDQELSER